MSGGHARLAGELEAVHPEHQPAVPPFRDLDLIDGAPEAPVVGLRPRQRLEGRIREPDSLGLPRGTRQVAGVGRSSTGRAARSSTVQRRHRHRWCSGRTHHECHQHHERPRRCARRSPSASDDTSPIGPDQVARREDGRLPHLSPGTRPVVDPWWTKLHGWTTQRLGPLARAVVDSNAYMTLATADPSGVPWASPCGSRRRLLGVLRGLARGSALTEHRGSTRDRDRDLRLHRARGCRAGCLPRGDRRPGGGGRPRPHDGDVLGAISGEGASRGPWATSAVTPLTGSTAPARRRSSSSANTTPASRSSSRYHSRTEPPHSGRCPSRASREDSIAHLTISPDSSPVSPNSSRMRSHVWIAG